MHFYIGEAKILFDALIAFIYVLYVFSSFLIFVNLFSSKALGTWPSLSYGTLLFVAIP